MARSTPQPRPAGRVAHVAWVSLGANLGHRRRTIERALRWLDALPGSRVVATSALRLTDALTLPGAEPQPPYLNGACRLETDLAPRTLLSALQDLEDAAGRPPIHRRRRWSPRALDLDLLLYDELVLDSPALTLPHPRMHERRFVLEPLCELDPALRHPRLDASVRALLRRLP